MTRVTKIVLFSVLLTVGLLTAACPNRTSIADIESNPSRFLNRDVAIAGVVRDSYGLNVPLTNIRGGIYKVDDGTGSIWVVTKNSVPTKGSEIGVKGRVENGLSWNGRNYGLGMYEEDRRIRRR